jgi:hypothetical protein
LLEDINAKEEARRYGAGYFDGEHRSVACVSMIPTHHIYYRLIEKCIAHSLLREFAVSKLEAKFI